MIATALLTLLTAAAPTDEAASADRQYEGWHDGLYLHATNGLAFTEAGSTDRTNASVSGFAIQGNLTIGKFYRHNTAYLLDITYLESINPRASINNQGYSGSAYAAGAVGAGWVGYTESGAFVGGSVGLGVTHRTVGTETSTSGPGLGFNVWLGHEWWIGQTGVGLGLAGQLTLLALPGDTGWAQAMAAGLLFSASYSDHAHPARATPVTMQNTQAPLSPDTPVPVTPLAPAASVECVHDQDCRRGHFCSAGSCTQQCTHDIECRGTGGTRCSARDGRCH
jgi:hypothetical protein